MAKYTVKTGEHRDKGPDGKEVVYLAGDVVESEHELDKLFVGKFVKNPTEEPKPKKGTRRAVDLEEDEDQPTQDKAEDAEDDAEEETEEEHHDEKEPKDVTERFDLAVKNDLKVFFAGKAEGYTVKDGKSVLNKKPLKTKAKVEKFLKEHLSEDGGD